MVIWSFVLAVIGITGLVLAGSKMKIGWAIGLFAQVLWIIFALVTHQWGFIFSAVAYGYVYARNYWKWWTEEMMESM